jgi:two-component system alkaline phosphatase synthesis response regulator PhoP
MSAKILLVEDEESLSEVIKLNLELEGYRVSVCDTGRDAVQKFRSERFDIVLLDVMLPEMDGFTVCQTIRLENSRVPILFLTAKNSSADRIFGLKIGGDDYLSKPFNLEELLLRVEKLLLRSAESTPRSSSETLRIGKSTVNTRTFEVMTWKGEQLVLTKREIMLLKLLNDRAGEVVSRELILETVWGYDVYPSTRTIDNYILAFRKYFEPNPREPQHFHSIRGVGYKLTA